MSRLLLDERILSDGSHACTYASLAAGGIRIEDDAGPSGQLSMAALDRVMVRYGLPLEERPTATGDALDFGGGHRLRRFRFHAIVDAEGRDYLVWERPDHEPIAVIATHATAALRFLVTSLQKERPQESEG
jgi:hypothetical protein